MNNVYKELLFDIIADNIDLGIAVIDKDGYFAYYNNAIGELEGLESKDVLGKHIFHVFPSIDMNNSTIFRCLKTGTPIFNDIQSYLNVRGRKIFSIVTDIPIIVDGETVGAIEIAQDIGRIETLYSSIDNWYNKNVPKKISDNSEKANYYNFDDFITCNKDLLKLIEKVKKMARYDSNVLIYGETGTGKEIFAQSIHNSSRRRDKPFIAQNCAAIPENLLESILFGTEKGSFTGALDKEGLFEQANGGTLLLDELNSLPIYLQAKLLRVLQEGYIRKVGGSVDKKVDVRVIATINEKPSGLIKMGKLREDLFYRLSILYIYIPPLRARKEDLFALTNYYFEKYSSMINVKTPKISDEVINLFDKYKWKGNVRELKNVIEYIMITIDKSKSVEMKHLPNYLVERFKNDIDIDGDIDKKKSYQDMVSSFEKKLIVETLIKCRWNVSRTSKILNIKRQTLQNKIKKFGIDKTDLS